MNYSGIASLLRAFKSYTNEMKRCNHLLLSEDRKLLIELFEEWGVDPQDKEILPLLNGVIEWLRLENSDGNLFDNQRSDTV
jgi:hypothetical protein